MRPKIVRAWANRCRTRCVHSYKLHPSYLGHVDLQSVISNPFKTRDRYVEAKQRWHSAKKARAMMPGNLARLVESGQSFRVSRPLGFRSRSRWGRTSRFTVLWFRVSTFVRAIPIQILDLTPKSDNGSTSNRNFEEHTPNAKSKDHAGSHYLISNSSSAHLDLSLVSNVTEDFGWLCEKSGCGLLGKTGRCFWKTHR